MITGCSIKYEYWKVIKSSKNSLKVFLAANIETFGHTFALYIYLQHVQFLHMKNVLNIVIIASFFIASCSPGRQIAQSDNYNQSDNYDQSDNYSQSDNYNYSDNYNNADVTYQTFYDELQPYGNWINYPEYGRVWQPYAGKGFRPYETGGRWVSTVDGWAWASDYNWGWAPFHYGRWLYDQSIGWAWVPGYEWAPAWVTWGQYNDYYAWAPLAPGINISFGNTWRAPSNYWCFVPRNYINYSDLNRYTVQNNYNTNVNNITIINNYNSYNQKDYYHRGPDYKEVQRFTRQPITPVGIALTNKPGLSRVINKQFEIYRPSLAPNAANSNSSTRQITVPNKTRVYNGSVRENSKPETSINAPGNNRIRKNPNFNKVEAGDNRGVLSNGVNNGSNVTQEDIDNTNRRLQQQQMDRIRRLRTQTPGNNPSILDNPVRTRQIPQQNTEQNILRQPPVRNNFPADNVQPTRPRSRMQEERIMQRPAFPQQNERIMRQPQVPSMPGRVESRGSNPVRNMPPIQRQGNPLRRP